MRLPPEFNEDEDNDARGLAVAIIVSLAFYLLFAIAIYLHTR